jgi:hypothetical protein
VIGRLEFTHRGALGNRHGDPEGTPRRPPVLDPRWFAALAGNTGTAVPVADAGRAAARLGRGAARVAPAPSGATPHAPHDPTPSLHPNSPQRSRPPANSTTPFLVLS